MGSGVAAMGRRRRSRDPDRRLGGRRPLATTTPATAPRWRDSAGQPAHASGNNGTPGAITISCNWHPGSMISLLPKRHRPVRPNNHDACADVPVRCSTRRQPVTRDYRAHNEGGYTRGGRVYPATCGYDDLEGAAFAERPPRSATRMRGRNGPACGDHRPRCWRQMRVVACDAPMYKHTAWPPFRSALVRIADDPGFEVKAAVAHRECCRGASACGGAARVPGQRQSPARRVGLGPHRGCCLGSAGEGGEVSVRGCNVLESLAHLYECLHAGQGGVSMRV